MTFDEKREQVQLAQDIGKILDRECSSEDQAELLEKIREQGDGEKLLNDMAGDNALLQQAVPADMPSESMDRLKSVIDHEFGKRASPARSSNFLWGGVIVQMAAALVLIAGTFVLTAFWMQSRMDDTIALLAVHMETERVLLAQSVQDALETRVSGEPVHIGQNENWSEILTPIKTYKSKSGHWCRQYLRETNFGGRDLSVKGTACRDRTGTWTTVFAEPVSDNFSPPSAGT